MRWMIETNGEGASEKSVFTAHDGMMMMKNSYLKLHLFRKDYP